MSFDIVDTERNLGERRPVLAPEPGTFDNFLGGAGRFAMQGFAKTGRAVSMALGGAAVTSYEGFDNALHGKNSTELRDSFFRFHDEVFQGAVDSWTPKASETGAAAEIAGTLLSTLPLILAGPGGQALAVGSTQMSVGEDLVRKGVDPTKAQAVGAVQAAGLGLGIWAPILGQTGFQRVVLGGAGFNVGQGVVTRGVSGSILQGTSAEQDFQAFDWPSVTLDALLGLAFGGIAHLSPAQRKQGQVAWERISDWVQGLKPSALDALITLRQAQHLSEESAPGKLATPEDVEAHTARVRTAIEQLAQDKPVQVEDLPPVKVEQDASRQAAAEKVVRAMEKEAERVAKAHGIQTEPIPAEQPSPPKADATTKPDDKQRSAGTKNERPTTEGGSGEKTDIVAMEAERFVTERPDLELIVGRDAHGEPIRQKAREYLEDANSLVKQAEDDAKLFAEAAACMQGAS